jgi:hypothetical protein
VSSLLKRLYALDFYNIVTDSIFAGSWVIDEKTDLSKPLLIYHSALNSKAYIVSCDASL